MSEKRLSVYRPVYRPLYRLNLIPVGMLLGALPLLGALLTAPDSLRADGGTLRVANVPMGAYRVSVFTDPTPIPPDSIDVSVLVTTERGRGVADGLDIQVNARRLNGQGGPDGPGGEVEHAATREQAEDPRYYAAKFALGSEGLWEIRVRVLGPEGEGETAFQVDVQEPGFLGNPYLILTLAFLPLLLVAIWFRRTRSDPSAPAAPAGKLS